MTTLEGDRGQESEEKEEEEEEQLLSFVQLSDDNKAMFLNGEKQHSLSIPINFSKKSIDTQIKITESIIYNGCVSYNYNYVSSENVNKRAREVVGQ